jgi:Competence protein CoiA-like family
MLVARDSRNDEALVLPDCESEAMLDEVRELARAGILLCPACRALLWLRAGQKRCAHFAHRTLADCPQVHVSLPILECRRLLYRFFQERIQSGKLPGRVELEPAVTGLPNGTKVDLIVRRTQRPAVAIVLLEGGLKPEARDALKSTLATCGFIFRPVFLASTLKQSTDELFLLTTTQRAFKHHSVFGRRSHDEAGTDASLHFLDPANQRWTSLRGLFLRHLPQAYHAHSVRISTMNELLWSEGEAEWTHPDEPRLSGASEKSQSERSVVVQAGFQTTTTAVAEPVLDYAKVPEETPSWLTTGLLCLGCGQTTIVWQKADLGAGTCVCKSCFEKGVRH